VLRCVPFTLGVAFTDLMSQIEMSAWTVEGPERTVMWPTLAIGGTAFAANETATSCLQCTTFKNNEPLLDESMQIKTEA